MRLLTYNLWHGLAPTEELVYFKKLEPDSRRRQREIRQRELLREWAPDVAFLQEVNPLPERTTDLKSTGPYMAFAQPDLAGIRCMGFGVPFNLNNGLLTLVNEQFLPRPLAALKLSGSPMSVESGFVSVQWRETRFANLTEIMVPSMGRVLTINTHLHHGLENTTALRGQLRELAKSEGVSGEVALEIELRLTLGDERRLQEINRLLDHLSRLDRYDVMILGGDLNASPDSATLKALRNFGFQDLAELSGNPEPTFDSKKNTANHVFLEDFPLTVQLDDLSFVPALRAKLNGLIRQFETEPRRLDYLLVYSSGRKIKLKSFELGGGVDEESGFAASDHFACLSEIELENS